MAHLPEPSRPRPAAPPARRRAGSLVLHPSMWRSAVSPTAVVVTAAGAGIGVADHSIVVGMVLAVGAWVTRMAAAAMTLHRRERASAPRPAQLDPWSAPEPWRGLLVEAGEAQTRFNATVEALPAGPVRDRMQGWQPQLWAAVAQLGDMARQGAALSGGTVGQSAPRQRLTSQMRQVQSQRSTTPPGTSSAAALDRREEALAAQLRAMEHAEAAAGELQDRVRMALARLQETVTEASAIHGTDRVAPALAELSDGLVALQQALIESTSVPPGPAGP